MYRKALNNPLEGFARKNMATIHTLAFEGAAKSLDWGSLGGVVQVT